MAYLGRRRAAAGARLGRCVALASAGRGVSLCRMHLLLSGTANKLHSDVFMFMAMEAKKKEKRFLSGRQPAFFFANHM